MNVRADDGRAGGSAARASRCPRAVVALFGYPGAGSEVVATVFGAGVGPGQATYAVPSSIVEERVRLAERRAGGP